MNKLLQSSKGLLLTLKNWKTFKPAQLFSDKRVAIVGPADSAYDKLNAGYIDGFDYVIRINKTPSSWNKENEKFIGRKTDIWFHSFFENTLSGGGPLQPEIIHNLNIKYLVNPRPEFKAYRRTFNFYRKYQKNIPVYHLNAIIYKDLIAKFPKHLKPTVGFVALYAALTSPCKELYVTGFTFFKTPYAKGYRDHLIDMKENEKHFKKQGIHDSDLEYRLFKNALKESQCKEISVDDKLQEILQSE